MAIWIKASEIPELQQVFPADGKKFSLRELQHYVQGYIEALDLGDGSIMWLNEDGKRQELAYNPAADIIAHRSAFIQEWDRIVGDVLITNRTEAGEDEDEEEE